MISTVACDCDSRPIARNTSCIAGAWPRISGVSLGCLGRRLLPQALFDRAPDQFDRMVDVERLGQILECAALERGDRALEIGIRGHDDDRQVRIALLRLLQELQARFARHPDVAYHHLRRLCVERVQRLARADENVLYAMFSRVSAFSNTQRIERSSSMIQTGFIGSEIIAFDRRVAW